MDLDRRSESDHEFKGPVTITNWARTRAQRIIRDISFETQQYDIYDPYFSSQSSNIDPRESILQELDL